MGKQHEIGNSIREENTEEYIRSDISNALRNILGVTGLSLEERTNFNLLVTFIFQQLNEDIEKNLPDLPLARSEHEVTDRFGKTRTEIYFPRFYKNIKPLKDYISRKIQSFDRDFFGQRTDWPEEKIWEIYKYFLVKKARNEKKKVY